MVGRTVLYGLPSLVLTCLTVPFILWPTHDHAPATPPPPAPGRPSRSATSLDSVAGAPDGATLHLGLDRWVRLAPLFTANMVLQRGLTNCVWGHASHADMQITVAVLPDAGDPPPAATTSPGGGLRWQICFGPPPHTHSARLRVTARSAGAERTLTLVDVVWGDVYLCSGQSNMWWPVAKHRETPLLEPQPRLRLLLLHDEGAPEPLPEPRIASTGGKKSGVPAQWTVADDAAHYAEFSALCYMAAVLLLYVCAQDHLSPASPPLVPPSPLHHLLPASLPCPLSSAPSPMAGQRTGRSGTGHTMPSRMPALQNPPPPLCHCLNRCPGIRLHDCLQRASVTHLPGGQ